MIFSIFFRTYILIFLLRLKELVILECKFRFCMKNCVYSHLETSGDGKVGQKNKENKRKTLNSIFFIFFWFFRFFLPPKYPPNPSKYLPQYLQNIPQYT